MPPAASLLVSISLAHISDVLARSYDECYAMGEGSVAARSLVLFIICAWSAPQLSQSERTTQSAAKHRKLRKYKTMRTLLLLVSGAAGLQLHKNIKLAAPALPVVLPSAALAAADSYEYGSA